MKSLLLLIAFGGCALMGGGGQVVAADGGTAVFTKLCAPCHGPDGRARTRAARKLGVKDLTKSRIADEQIRTQIITGWKDKQGVLKMPAFEDKLTEKQLAELVGVVKGLRK